MTLQTSLPFSLSGCAHKDSLGLMKDYGFVVPGNVNDRVPFSTGGEMGWGGVH